MGMTYTQYYKIIDKKPTKKELAQKAKAEKLMQKLRFEKEESDRTDRLVQRSLVVICPHCHKQSSVTPIPEINVSHHGCDCCGNTETSYSIELRCNSCERIIFYRKG